MRRAVLPATRVPSPRLAASARAAVSLVAVVALAAACGKKSSPEPAATKGKGSGAAPTAPVALDASPPPPDAPGPFVMPTDATLVPESSARKADATALGAAVVARLVTRVQPSQGDDLRRIDHALVLTGTRAMIVELGFALDDGARYPDAAASLVTVPALEPPRPFVADDRGHATRPFAGPLLYRVDHATPEGMATALAIARDGDALVVWRSQALPEEQEEPAFEPWVELSRVALAPGAALSTAR